jgi:hypothetical protein
LVFACTHPQSIVRFEEKMGENCDSKVQFWKKEIEENRSAVHLLQETMQGGSPPSLLGKQSQSGNIRFTAGQYWLIIKINGTNSVNFVGNSVNFVGNMLSNRNFS